jgi:hypothetical protein
MAKHAVKHAKRLSPKAIVAIVAAVVMLCGMIGGTLAWLIDKTDAVVNTFTYGDINIKLDETILDANGNTVDTDNDGTPDRGESGNVYKMIPGQTITKDPILTVDADSEDCYVFVKLVESTNAKFGDFMTYEIDPAWAALAGVDGVYYRVVSAETDLAAGDLAMNVIKDKTVTVKDTVTKEMLNNLTDTTYPTLTVTGYAVQQAGMADVAAAWAAINPTNP